MLNSPYLAAPLVPPGTELEEVWVRFVRLLNMTGLGVIPASSESLYVPAKATLPGDRRISQFQIGTHPAPCPLGNTHWRVCARALQGSRGGVRSS